MNKCRFIPVAVILAALLLYGCGKPTPPLDEIRAALRGVPTYSVVLSDIKEEGNFFKDHFHKYRIIKEAYTTETAWLEVSKDHFLRNLSFLGMTIFVKKDGKETGAVGPPGYEYVNNHRYGSWHHDRSGQSFWVFYGQYRLMSDLLGPGPIYRSHYNTYSSYRSTNRPYYGPGNRYGTNGSFTKRQKPNFYSRRTSRDLVKRASFKDRVNQRVGRSRTNVRGRSGRAGK
ncbi:MAG: hypothetical protein QGG48_06275 [Desulfatiglandales bacterium]|nr:hypothetical protein [Desulfatiglandales bacterium]